MRRTLLILLTCLAPPVAAAEDDLAVREAIAAQFRLVDAADVVPSPVPGLYQVFMGPQVYYVSADGEHVIFGDMFEMASNANLTDPARNLARLRALEAMGEERMIVFQAEDERYEITVFTDITCGYCRRLHREIDSYLERGITVRYAFYPRAGQGSQAWLDAERVWCADDPQLALTLAKRDEPFDGDRCAGNPITEHYGLGRMIGFSGTPAIITHRGELVPGYLPADRLLAHMTRD